MLIIKHPIHFNRIIKLGWKRDIPDGRDLVYKTAFPFYKRFPKLVDLRNLCPSVVYDQGDLGSCTANALAAAMEFERLKQKLPDFIPSRLFIYYQERILEGTVDSDEGAMLRDGMKALAKWGVPPEEPDWPYDISKFKDKPSDIAYQDALQNKALQYLRVNQSLNAMKDCLASGYPFVYGFSVYESFMSDSAALTGIITMPNFNRESNLGGHAVMAVGYDDSKNCFISRNSWGDTWGDKGYFYIPYKYLTNSNLAADFWTVRLVGS